MPVARYREPDHSKGDESTIGGYMAVHERPAALEGSDGFSYSVEIMAEQAGETGVWSAFFLFVRWARVGAQTPEGHIESDYLAHDASEDAAIRRLGATPIGAVKAVLDRLVADQRGSGPERRWWDAMRDEGNDA